MTFVVPNPERVWGIDISGRWDGNVDFAATKRAGATFAIIKCIDGTVPTRLWKENRIRAFTAGLIVGEYAWLYRDADVSCKGQALATWELIKNEPKQIPVCVDFEWTKFMGSPANPNYSDLDKWVTEFTRLSGYKPGFYSAAGYMNDLGAMPQSLRNKFSYFWVANYGVSSPTMPRGLTDWDFWQFAATGEAAVIAPNDTGKMETDVNYWNGTLETLKELAGVSGGIITPPAGETTMQYKVTWENGARERQGDSINADPTGKTYPFDAVFNVIGDPIVKVIGYEVWGKVGEGRYVALIYNGQERARIVLPPEQPTITLKHVIKVYNNGSLSIDDGPVIP